MSTQLDKHTRIVALVATTGACKDDRDCALARLARADGSPTEHRDMFDVGADNGLSASEAAGVMDAWDRCRGISMAYGTALRFLAERIFSFEINGRRYDIDLKGAEYEAGQALGRRCWRAVFS